MRSTQPTMVDVAKHAGVSPITVSRVLNGYEFVKADTREKVLEAVDALGYRPNLAARALVTNKTKSIGVFVADAFGHGPAAALWAIESAARDAGYAVTVVSQSDDDYDSIVAGLHRLAAQGVDGIVMIAPQRASERAVFDSIDAVPIVVLAAYDAGGHPPVMLDSVLGSRLAVDHLVGLGHDVIAHLSGPAGWAASEARERGWRDQLAARGLAAGPLFAGDWTAESGYRAGVEELAQHPQVTAVYAASDAMAQGLLLALHEQGRGAPAGISVVGFDDVPEAAFFIPPLTTVRQDFAVLGRRCIAAIVELVEGNAPLAFDPLEPTLIIRGSTARPVR